MTPRLLNILESSYRELRPRAAMPKFVPEFFPFANVNNTIRLRGAQVLVRFSDLLEGAPDSVLRAIAHILLAKLYRKRVSAVYGQRYRQYIAGRDFAARTHLVRQLRGRKQIAGPQGHLYNLDEVFDDLNRRFFHGLLGRPLMTWSRTQARNSLGHYDPAHNAIVISRLFDHPRVPRYALEYIVYHEMLHLKYPVRWRGGRRCVHPPQFQADEKLFAQLAEAKKLLESL